MTMPMGDEHNQHLAAKHRDRRNGLWNIFEGLDLEVLGRLGLSEDMLKELLTLDACPAMTFVHAPSDNMSPLDHVEVQLGDDDHHHSPALLRALSAASSASRCYRERTPSFSKSKEGGEQAAETRTTDQDDMSDCCCDRARMFRSLSASVNEELRELHNRHRRNAVGNLFEILTPSQQLLLVEHLQAQLQKLRCLCDSSPRQAQGSEVVACH